MLHGGGLKKASPARTIETHSPPGIEKTLNNMLREINNKCSLLFLAFRDGRILFHADFDAGLKASLKF